MKLASFVKLIFLSVIILLISTNAIAQPCNITPPLNSVDINGDTTTISCNRNPLILSTTSPAVCPTCTYLWSTGDTNYSIFVSTSGNYSVTVTDPSGIVPCRGVSATVSVTIGSLSIPILDAAPHTVCTDENTTTQPAVLRVTNPCIGCQYNWYKLGDTTVLRDSTVEYKTTEPREHYYVRVLDTLGCGENSNIVYIESDTISKPLLLSNTTNLCDNNVATLSTINCNGCNYRWKFYDFIPEKKLMISGVYDGTRRKAPKGIELYAVGNIPDLSVYRVGVGDNNTAPLASGRYISLPPVSLSSGDYYYIAKEQAEFETFFGFAPNLADPKMDIDGNDPIVLEYGQSTVDVYGKVGYDTIGLACSVNPLVCNSLTWAHNEGWAYRKANAIPRDTFVISEWDVHKDRFSIIEQNSFLKNDSFPHGTFYNSSSFGTTTGSIRITGIYVGTEQAGNNSKCIELIVLADTIHLAGYSVQIPSGAASPRIVINLPNLQVYRGNYIYIASDTSKVKSFLHIEPSASTILIPDSGLANMLGDKHIKLNYDSTASTTVLIDEFGTSNNSSPPAWSCQDGWAYRVRHDSGTFVQGNWLIKPNSFLPTNAVFGSKKMPIGTFRTSAVGEVEQIIPQANSSIHQTQVPGLYAVELEYPNSCISTSKSILLDTSIFNPQITALSSSATIATDIRDSVYLCSGGYVDLFMTGSHQQPPSGWIYQWYRNGQPINGSNGFRHRSYTSGRYYLEVINSDGCLAASKVITILASTNGSNPSITASDLYLCSSTAVVTLATSSCNNCTYQWKSGISDLSDSLTQKVDSNSRAAGYYVQVTDRVSKCSYNSRIIEIRDTIYPPPVITVLGNPLCNTNPLTLSATPCSNCNYEWSRVDTSQSNSWVTAQPTFQTDTSGKYRVRLAYSNGCKTGFSSAVRVSFQNINANITALSTGNICNGKPVTINALPDTANCVDCKYTFLKDGVAMQQTTLKDRQKLTVAGDYQVIITNYDNCSDTSTVLTVEEININSKIKQSANKICSANSEVILEVDSCIACSYQWYLGTIALSSVRDTFWRVSGYTAANTYHVEVSKGGCVSKDSVVLDSVPERFVKIGVDPTVSTAPIQCDGSRVLLVDQCNTCIINNQYTYQWYSLTDTLIGANFGSFQIDTPGTYYVQTIDANLCIVLSDTITVEEFKPDPDLSLDFTTLGTNGVVPITYGSFSIDDYLEPVSLRSTGAYTSLTAQSAINSADSLNVGIAGSGHHYITYTYQVGNAQGNCEFSTTDTLEILGAVAIKIANTKLGAPPLEACIGDTLEINLTNFTFIPDTVTFLATGGRIISIGVTPSLSQFAGVYSGSFEVEVPIGARTGKITLSGGNNRFVSPNFFVILHPSVAVDVLSTVQPICSNLDTIALRGVPAGGELTASYVGMPTGMNLITNSFLSLDSVANYNNGVQHITVLYKYKPRFTSGTLTCPAIVDTLELEIRNTELDRVDYTPIAVTQYSEPMANLTKLVYPLTARTYPISYGGTHIYANKFLPSNLLTNWSTPFTHIVKDTITYEMNNAGCVAKSMDFIEVLPAPNILQSIPPFLCSESDTIFIVRDANGICTKYRNNTIVDSIYTYEENVNIPVDTPLTVRYSEYVNLMEITSSNGGLDTINFLPPNESYYFVPSNVTGTSTTITIKFKYYRLANYFSGGALLRTDTTTYTIAEISNTFQIENPSVVSINPAILADTVFCPIDTSIQLLGIPAGGKYYLRGDTSCQPLTSNIFNPMRHPIDTSYQLIYVHNGKACADSATTGIYVPDIFAIEMHFDNTTGRYCETSPNDTIVFDIIGSTRTIIDTSTAQFFVNGIQTGTIFSPSQVGPPGDYNVRYAVSDIYGCSAEDSTTFKVFPIPQLSMPAIDSVFCKNDDTVKIHLYKSSVTSSLIDVTTWDTTTTLPLNDTFSLYGDSIIQGGGMNERKPYFLPSDAGEGTHYISYVYTDANNCQDSIGLSVKVLGLPDVSITTTNRRPLKEYYCENESIPIFGFPTGTAANSGYGYIGDSSHFNSTNRVFKPNVDSFTPGIVRGTLYYYYEDRNGCRETVEHEVKIRNFTIDSAISFGMNSICASDTNILIVNPRGGFSLDGLGYFTSNFATAFLQLADTSQLTDTVYTDSIIFNPALTGIDFADRDVVLTFHYTDTARVCLDSISSTIKVLALPHLTLSKQLATTLSAMEPLGSKLVLPRSDTFYHICETEPNIPIYAYNTTGLYDVFTGSLSLLPPDLISSDTGTYSLSHAIDSNGTGTNLAYAYKASKVGFGLDTVRYTYKDNRGCVNSVDYYVMVDSLPVLSFAELSNYDSESNRYVYCEAEPNPPSILPAPTGVSWTMTFNGQNITSVPFDLLPDTLAVAGVNMDYPLRYDYTGQIYQSGEVCSSYLEDTIQIRPSPQMAWVNVPSDFCMSDSAQRFSLSATPYGGTFVDATNNYQVTAGIVGDSLFNPTAQAGERNIYYYYLDTSSGCSDTIKHTIYVYNKPKINFDLTGGCAGQEAELTPQIAPYGLQYNGVAVDSITQVIWNFGDGTIDTFNVLPDTFYIPTDTHTYAAYGVFYPSLTVVNQGSCDTTFARRVIISPKVVPYDNLPYVESFDAATNGWFQASADTLSVNGIVQDSLWEWGVIDGNVINTVLSGNTAWATRLTQTYGQGEDGWVYSPCFDLTNLERPMIKMDIWRATQNGVDGAVLQYYDDVNQSWKVLGKPDKGIHWYRDEFVVSAPGHQRGLPRGWTGTSSTWEDARYRLDNVEADLRNRDNIRFRIAFASDAGTLIDRNDGFAFDNVMVGSRTRNVLLEHFSAVGYPGIEGIENNLYRTIYNNLYGRDVSLIQYHSDKYISNDALYLLNPIDNRQRHFLYSITGPDEARVDGKVLINKTSDLLNYPNLEILDMEALEDPKFKIEFLTFPSLQYNGPNGGMQATIRFTALEDMPLSNYSMMATVTKDSMVSLTGHTTMAVLLANYPNNLGTNIYRDWSAGDFVDVQVSLPDINPSMHPNTHLLQLVAFVQDADATPREVFQAATTRDLTIFTGALDTTLHDISVDKLQGIGVEATQFKLYPNPAIQQFQVDFDVPLKDTYKWELVNVLGQPLRYGKTTTGTTAIQVDTDDLTAGFYFFILKNKNVYIQRKIVVKKP